MEFDLGTFFAGGFAGGILVQILKYIGERKMVENATEKAEKMVPDYLEKPIGKLLDQAAEELKDTSNQDKTDK